MPGISVKALLWLVGLLLLCALLTQPVQANEAKARKVLLLHSYEPGNPWTDRLHQHLIKALRVASFPVEISTEYLGTKRNDPQSLYPYLADLLDARRLAKPDLLIITDNNALEFVQQYRSRLFADVPIVFAGVNPVRDAWRHRDPLMTGVLESSDPAANIKLVKALFPQLKQLVFITDQTRTGQIEKIRFARALEQQELPFATRFIDDWTLQSLKQSLRSADNQTLFFLISAFRDRDNLQISLQDAVTLLLNNSQVPVMSAWPAGLEAGLLGGVMTNAKLQAQGAARMALDILRGRSLAQMPVAMTSPSVAMFNYEQLRRFNIDPKLLPPGSKIWNRPQAWYEQDIPSLYAWPVSLSLGAILLFLLWLWLREQNRTHIARSQLLRLEEEARLLNSLFEQLPVPACWVNTNGRVSKANAAFTELAGEQKPGQALSAYLNASPELAQRMHNAFHLSPAQGGSLLLSGNGDEGFRVGLEPAWSAKQQDLFEQQHSLLECLDISADLPVACQALLARLAGMHPHLGCVLQSWDPARNQLSLLACAGMPRAFNAQTVQLQQGAPQAAAQKRVRVISADISQDPDWQHGVAELICAGVHTCWAEPVLYQGRLLGVLSFYFTQPREPSDELLKLLETGRQLSAVLIRQQQIYNDGHKYAAALEQSPCMVMITDTQGVIEYVNGQFSAVSGYSREDALGHTPALLASAGTPRSLYQNLWQTILSGLDWRGELFNRTKSGQSIRCSLSVSPLFNEQGQITHFIGISQDISAQYRRRLSEQTEHSPLLEP